MPIKTVISTEKKNINLIYRFDGTIKDNLYNRINDK